MRIFNLIYKFVIKTGGIFFKKNILFSNNKNFLHYILISAKMNIIEEFKKRFSKKGYHRKTLNKLKRLQSVYPDSSLLKETIAVVKKKIYSSCGADFLPQYQRNLLFKDMGKDGVLDINGLKFDLSAATSKAVFCLEYIDLFSSDLYFRNNFSINRELQDILSAFEIEGPYQNGSVFLKEGDVVVDAGSNMGIFALLAAKYKNGKVYAFEPGKEALALLHKNIALNEANDQVTVCPLGLSHSDYTANFFVDHQNIGASTIVAENTTNSNNEKDTIDCVSLDSWAEKNNISKIDFIKADIEGAERFLLQGATKVLRQMQPKLSICTYHLPDDPQVLEKIVKDANPNYIVMHANKKMYAYVKS